MFAEPGPTQGDIHFSLFGFPVRIHPLFWLVAVLLNLQPAAPGQEPVPRMLMWIPAVLLAIVVHELGHALVMRRFGSRPHIVLYAMGGLAVPDGPYPRTPSTAGQILISLAGPGAGFLLAASITGGVALAGLQVDFEPVLHIPLVPRIVNPARLAEFLNDLLWVSVLWGFFNLLPIYPLDGGQAAEELLSAINSHEGVRWAMILSMATAGLMAAYQLVKIARGGAGPGQGPPLGLFTVLLFGYLGYLSYQRLQAHDRPWR